MSSYMGPNLTFECYMVANDDPGNAFYITVQAYSVFEARRIVEAQYSNARIFGQPKELHNKR